MAENDWFIFAKFGEDSQYDFLLSYSCMDSEYLNISANREKSLRILISDGQKIKLSIDPGRSQFVLV